MSPRPKTQNKKAVGKILLVSYFFPPTAGGGVFRPLAMVKYLSRMGWHITVITSTTPKHYPADPALEKQIPPSVEVIRMPVLWEGSWGRRLLGKLSLDWIPKHLLMPDERIFWAEKASTLAKKMILNGGFDCLYTTGPPFSILLAGLWLKREKKLNIPWIAEFRDPWTLTPYLAMPNANHRRFAKDTEADLVERATAVVMVTPAFGKMMREKYVNAKNIYVVQNGFDQEDFDRLPSKEKIHNSEFTIVASGTVFGRNNMDDFINALERLKKEKPDVYGKLRVKFQGLPDYRLNRRLLENGLTDRCSSRGFVNHHENIMDLRTSDLLILPVGNVTNSEGHIPSRTYEYLASGTKILAICPDGDLNNLLSPFIQNGNVIRIKPGDINEVTNAIEDALRVWESGGSNPPVNSDILSTLTRKARAKELESIIRGISGKGKKT